MSLKKIFAFLMLIISMTSFAQKNSYVVCERDTGNSKIWARVDFMDVLVHRFRAGGINSKVDYDNDGLDLNNRRKVSGGMMDFYSNDSFKLSIQIYNPFYSAELDGSLLGVRDVRGTQKQVFSRAYTGILRFESRDFKELVCGYSKDLIWVPR